MNLGNVNLQVKKSSEYKTKGILNGLYVILFLEIAICKIENFFTSNFFVPNPKFQIKKFLTTLDI